MRAKRVAVVGGGFAGLACAQTLVEAGAEVVVFEKAERLGGLASGFRARGWEWSLEHFYHHWFASDVHVKTFARKWGLEAGLRFSEPSTVMQLRSGAFRALDSAVALLRYPDLPFFDRIRMGAALALLKASRSWKALERTTAQDWCTRTMGKKGYEAIWAPLLHGKFGMQWAGQVNMAWLWARIACRTKALGTFEGGFAVFVGGAHRALERQGVRFHLGHSLPPLTPVVGEGEIAWKVSPSEEPFDAVVVAASPGALASLVPKSPAHAIATTSANASAKSIRPSLGAQVVILSLTKSVGPHYWYSLRKTESQPFLALIEHTNFVSKTHFADENIVYLADYVDVASPEWQRTDAQLRSLAYEVCRHINPGLVPSDLLESWVLREPFAQPIPLVNHSRHLPPLEVPGAPRVFHASMAHVYPWDRGTNFALELGERVAREALLQLRSTSS
jgi:protoporphyrinogen oxidase